MGKIGSIDNHKIRILMKRDGTSVLQVKVLKQNKDKSIKDGYYKEVWEDIPIVYE